MPYRPVVRYSGFFVTACVVAAAWWMLDATGPPPPRVAEFPSATPGTRLAVILTGDAGARTTVRDLAHLLARAGLPTIAVAATGDSDGPRGASASVDRLLRDHLARWDRQRVLLIGYSRGAGMAPFVANRLDGDLRRRIDAMVLVGLTPRVSFRRTWTDRWRRGPRPTDLPVLPELERLRGIPLLCLYHELEERDSFCSALDGGSLQREVRPLDDDGESEGTEVARRALDFLR